MTIPEAAQLVIQAGALVVAGENCTEGYDTRSYRRLQRIVIRLSGYDEGDIEIKFTDYVLRRCV